MKVFAIGDLHLAAASSKPMDIFGVNWDNHDKRIAQSWKDTVGENDVVLVPGDISWAMSMEQALPDIAYIAALPGKKILLRGNHDYWWNSLTKVRVALPDGMYALQNDCAVIDSLCVCGTRAWTIPSQDSPKEDIKIYDREVGRMQLSLKAAKAASGDCFLIGMTHYPPFDERQSPSGFTRLYQEYGVSLAVYGHLHGKSCWAAFEGELEGVEYRLVSCDHIGFAPKLIAEL